MIDKTELHSKCALLPTLQAKKNKYYLYIFMCWDTIINSIVSKFSLIDYYYKKWIGGAEKQVVMQQQGILSIVGKLRFW